MPVTWRTIAVASITVLAEARSSAFAVADDYYESSPHLNRQLTFGTFDLSRPWRQGALAPHRINV